MANDIKNSAARIWTPMQLRETVKQAKANGYTVTKDKGNGMTVITHPDGDVVLRSARMGNTELVRIDQAYFGK